MLTLPSQTFWHHVFRLGVFVKAINGVWETATGCLVLFLSGVTLNRWVLAITRNELLEDPNDRLMNFLSGAWQNFSHDTKVFAAIYLLLHGLINLLLSVQLLRHRSHAYLFAAWIMTISILYQLYRISLYHSVLLTAVTVFDAMIVWLILHEYRTQSRASSGLTV